MKGFSQRWEWLEFRCFWEFKQGGKKICKYPLDLETPSDTDWTISAEPHGEKRWCLGACSVVPSGSPGACDKTRAPVTVAAIITVIAESSLSRHVHACR